MRNANNISCFPENNSVVLQFLLLLKLLDVNRVANFFAAHNGWFCKFLTVTQFFYNTGFSNLRFNFFSERSMLSPSFTGTMIIMYKLPFG